MHSVIAPSVWSHAPALETHREAGCARAISACATRAIVLIGVLLTSLLLAACSDEPATGPVQIRYGRDTCDLCRMIISDPRFAAQIRGGPGHAAYKFDDIGDALIYLDRQTWKDDADVEFWVMDVEKGKSWLEARKAHYMSGMQSPMAHGFGAYADPRPGSVDFQTLRAAAAKRASSLLCRPEAEQLQSKMQK